MSKMVIEQNKSIEKFSEHKTAMAGGKPDLAMDEAI